MIPKTVAALDTGSPPDIAYSHDVQIAGKWAFDGKLEDISDVIEPMKDRFLPATIETAYLYNDKAKKKAFYGFVAEAADAACPVLEGHAGDGGLQGKRHPRHLEGILVVLVRQGPAGLSQGDQQPRLWHRQPDGRRIRPTRSSRS